MGSFSSQTTEPYNLVGRIENNGKKNFPPHSMPNHRPHEKDFQGCVSDPKVLITYFQGCVSDPKVFITYFQGCVTNSKVFITYFQGCVTNSKHSLPITHYLFHNHTQPTIRPHKNPKSDNPINVQCQQKARRLARVPSFPQLLVCTLG